MAVDATCCRIMGLDPGKIGYLLLAAGEPVLKEDRIPQTGESIASVASRYKLLPELERLRAETADGSAMTSPPGEGKWDRP